jgi:hypothetical protein
MSSFYDFVISSTKLEIRAEKAPPGSEGGGGEKGVGGRNDPNNVHTCE